MKVKIILIALIIIYIAVVFGICIFKYQNNFYNAIDLGIFAQAFKSLSQGQFLNVLIQGNQYFADHLSLMFFVFYPFYWLWQSPVGLLFLQTLFIALASWPLYLISKKFLSNAKSLLIVVLFLFNPFIISMNLFEFHWLCFSFFFIFWLFYFYLEKKWLWFYIFLIFSLAIREDVSLFVLGLAVFLFFQKFKSKGLKKALKNRQAIILFCSSIIWFFGSWLIIKYFNQEPNKFLIYFNWAQDWKLAWQHFLNLGQLELILQIFLPFAFLPLFKPKFLLISLFYYLQIAFCYGLPIVHLHYGALLLIPCYLATILVLFDWQNKKFKKFHLELYKKIAPVALVIAIVFLNINFGPWKELKYKNENVEFENYLINQIPENSAVVSSAKFFPKLISKTNVYSLERAFWGHKQFSEQKYIVPAVDYVLIDQEELVSYELKKNKRQYYFKNYPFGYNNLEKIIADNNLVLIENQNNYYLFGKSEKQAEEINLKPVEVKGYLELNNLNTVVIKISTPL